MKIGLVQMDIFWEDILQNMKKAEHYFREAEKQGIDLLVFPEMTLTGFSMNVEKTAGEWKKQVDFFRDMSTLYSATVVFGYPVRIAQGSRTYYENHLSVAEKGVILADYAKIHPFTYGEESRYFRGGNSMINLNWRDTVMGGFICYDLRFPEIFQLSSEKSEIIFVIANWPQDRISHWDILLSARAIENQCYIVGVNRTGAGGGLIYNGHSAIYSPQGERISRFSEQECMITGDFDLEMLRQYRRDFPVKKDRRTDLYSKLKG